MKNISIPDVGGIEANRASIASTGDTEEDDYVDVIGNGSSGGKGGNESTWTKFQRQANVGLNKYPFLLTYIDLIVYTHMTIRYLGDKLVNSINYRASRF